MSQKNTREESQSLGSFLRDNRTEKALSLDQAREFTKISLPILRAIEDDDYDSMPADAFCRAFYSMYAKYLGLDPDDILGRYLEARGLPASPSNTPNEPPLRKSGQLPNYAEPAPVSPGASLGVILVICLIGIAAACWYFDWNPLSSLSSQADSPQAPVQEEQLQQPLPEPLPENGALLNDPPVVPHEEESAVMPEHGATSLLPHSPDNEPGSSDGSSEDR